MLLAFLKTLKNGFLTHFFTTKPVGEGTGLGLSISYQIIVEKHGGQLECFSVPGEGTEFIVTIPLAPSNIKPCQQRHRLLLKDEGFKVEEHWWL
jgi:nitrogen-specific signal transduction histidine kinase